PVIKCDGDDGNGGFVRDEVKSCLDRFDFFAGTFGRDGHPERIALAKNFHDGIDRVLIASPVKRLSAHPSEPSAKRKSEKFFLGYIMHLQTDDSAGKKPDEKVTPTRVRHHHQYRFADRGIHLPRNLPSHQPEKNES